jgi:hypothetical protein
MAPVSIETGRRTDKMTISNLTIEQINVVLLYLQKQIDELRSIIESMNS